MNKKNTCMWSVLWLLEQLRFESDRILQTVIFSKHLRYWTWIKLEKFQFQFQFCFVLSNLMHVQYRRCFPNIFSDIIESDSNLSYRRSHKIDRIQVNISFVEESIWGAKEQKNMKGWKSEALNEKENFLTWPVVHHIKLFSLLYFH